MLKPLAAIVASALAVAVHAQPCPTWTHPQPIEYNPNGTVQELVRFNGKIVAAGTFSSVGGFTAANMAEFNGTTWTPMGNQPQAASGRYGVAVWGGKLYTAGTGAGAPYAGRGAVWNGSVFTDWPATGPSFNARFPKYLYPLGNGTFLIDGAFQFNDENGNLIRRRGLVTYDGAAFVPLSMTQFGPRVNPSTNANAIMQAVLYRGKILMRGVAALSTGDNWNDTNIPCPSGFCTFDGSTFAPLVAPALNGFPVDMAVYNDELYVIGPFTGAVGGTTPLRYIARYDEANQTWAKVGNGLSDQMTRFAVADDGSGERLHIFRTGSTIVTAYNDPNSTTTDTIAFRGSVMFDGVRFKAHGAGINNGLSGNAECAVSMDFGQGVALYVGGNNLFSAGFTNGTTLARRGPGPMTDTDGDGLFDPWEQNGIDVNCDGVLDLDLPAMGANWRKKDVFVEVDSMNGRAPHIDTLNRVVAAFANANITNVDGSQGVNLHVIFDPPDQSIPLHNFTQTWIDFHAVKADRFGNAADRSGPNRQAILDAKRLAFRYCVFGNKFGNTNSSGNSELPGNDFMVTLGGAAVPDGTLVPGGTPDQQAGTFMHELGHTLGLYHGGHQAGERFNYKPNYHSIMNYSWQLSWYRPGWTLDYSREVLPELDELHLDETAGIGGAPGSLTLSSPGRVTVPESGPVDWNRDTDFDEDVVADVNNVSGGYNSLDTLLGSHDWPNLHYNFRDTSGYANGQSPEVAHTDNHLTRELQALLDAAYTPPCRADLGIAGGLAGSDGMLDNNDFIAFINSFFAHHTQADLGVAGGLPGADGLYDNNDFIAFINHFFEGC